MAYVFNPFTGSLDNAGSSKTISLDYLPLSGGTITGNLAVSGTTTLSGTTIIGDESQIASLFVDNGRVGVNMETPNEALTVVGNISSNSTIYAYGGNSDLWNSTKTTVQSNSASWALDSTTDTEVRALTSNWQNTYTEFSTQSANNNSVYTTVNTNSATTWNYQGTDLKNLSSNWESTYTTVYSNSASWGAGTTVTTTSATQFLARVANADIVNLNRGDVVYTFGAIGDVMSVKKASNVSDLTSARTLGLVNETIIPNGIGYVTLGGSIDKLNLGSYNEGDILWLGTTAGTFTNVRPTQPNHGVYLGVVERANNGNGIAYVKVQNGQELDEIHDVLITSVSAGQILRRNNINNLWINTDDGSKWDSVYSTVNTNSATNWNYQGTDIKSLTGNWQNTYINQTNYLPLSGGTIVGSVSASGVLYSNGNPTITTVSTNSPGTSATTFIVAVSALPLIPEKGTLYILI